MRTTIRRKITPSIKHYYNKNKMFTPKRILFTPHHIPTEIKIPSFSYCPIMGAIYSLKVIYP